MRRPTPPDPLTETIAHVREAERAPADERRPHVIRARFALANARAALDDAVDALSKMTTPVVALMRPGVELRRRALEKLGGRLDAIDES